MSGKMKKCIVCKGDQITITVGQASNFTRGSATCNTCEHDTIIADSIKIITTNDVIEAWNKSNDPEWLWKHYQKKLKELQKDCLVSHIPDKFKI